jgi:hypothetical protein
MADRIFPNRIQEEALDSDLVFQGIDWDNFNTKLAEVKNGLNTRELPAEFKEVLAKKKSEDMPEAVENMFKKKNKENDKEDGDLSKVPEQFRKNVKDKQDKAKSKKHEDVDDEDVDDEDDENGDDDDMVRNGPKKATKKASVVFNHPSQLSAEAVEAAIASGDKALANTILAARHERRVRLASKIQSQIEAENDKTVKLAQRRAYREQLVKIAAMKDEEVEAMEKKCESCGMKYAGEECDCDSKKEGGYSKSDMKMKKATNLSSASKQAFAAKALAEGFPQEYIDAMLGETVVASNDLAEIKNVMASELNSNVKKAAVSSMIKVATLTDSDYSRLVDYWKNELGYGDQEWIDALFTKKYDK